MFRIRPIYDHTLPANREDIAQVQRILREQFPLISEAEVAALPEKLRDPLAHRFRTLLFVADDARWRVSAESGRRVLGFATLLHFPDPGFCYLDFISAAPRRTGSGVGGALYERVRQEARALGADGVFMECLPDDPALSPDPTLRAQNAARLRFYESYGARPVAGTAYETPVTPGDSDPPYLVFDGLGRNRPLRRSPCRRIVRAILERKYESLCPPEYVDRVVDSFRDDPVRLRPPRYAKAASAEVAEGIPEDRRIALVVNARHEIHHVRERGYVEAPVRIRAIRRELDRTGLFREIPAHRFSEDAIRAIHDRRYVEYFKRVCKNLPEGKSIYPYVFPIRNAVRPPRELAVRAGYFCIDTFTPLNPHAFAAARGAVDCALTAARRLREGDRLAYALVRPPGHHAERGAFGGFCYFNSNAAAARELAREGRVAILDIDYHHGNGQQDIFYDRADVLTVSIHGHPRFAYPYFSGFEDEIGVGEGAGFNVNFPLPEQMDGEGYRKILARAIRKIEAFAPRYLIVALGLDTAKGDPTGTWSLGAGDFEENGRMIGTPGLPTLVVQEGGYKTRSMGINARRFFEGLWAGAWKPKRRAMRRRRKAASNESSR
jgi:acetoin utilization deacetylase AcuC-like enzyme/GNAT superfamily N-acetyltransferase